MGLETATYISQLDGLWPLGGDPINKGDDHIRLIKNVLQSQFPNLTAAAINADNTELDILEGALLSTTELNILNGILASTSELNVMNGVTALTAEINRVTSIAGNGALDAFPVGTLITFQQTVAPTGWTKETTHNNKALRVVSGAAGAAGVTPFNTVFGAGKSAGSYTLLAADIPAHDHGSEGAHIHTLNNVRADASGGGTETIGGSSGNDGATPTVNSNGAHTHTSFGGDGGHSHTLSLDLQYVDLIIASKD